MLWYKAWLETRVRFLIGLGILIFMACGLAFEYRAVQQLMPLASSMSSSGGVIGRALQDAIAVQQTYRGFVWYQWVRQNLTQTWTLFALLLGTGGLAPQRGGLFTLSLPVSRAQLLRVRAATGLAELLALAVVPSVLIPLVSIAAGQRYGVGDAIVHAACVFVGGSAIFSLTTLFSTEFADAWTPALVGGVAVTALALLELSPAVAPFGVFHTMSAESYLEGNGLPWAGLGISVAASAALLYAAAANLKRRDF